MKFLSQINVNTEYTLPIVDGTNGQVLTTDGSGAVYWGSISIGALNLDGLQDVVITTPTSGQILRYGIPVGSEDPNPVWYNWSPNFLTFASSIDALADVTITSATTGQLLQWNGSAWVNWTPNYLTSYTETDTLATVTTRGNTTTNTITVGGATSNYLILSGASSLLDSKGLLKWESDHNSVGLYYADGKHFDIGQSQMWYVKNTNDATITKGTVVMATGAVGNSGNLEVQPLVADGSISGRFAIGIAMDDIAVGAFGFVKTEGTIRGIDTSEYTIGTVLYADPAIAGGLTSIEPTAPSLKLPIAFVVSAASNGAIGVRMTQGLDLHEIHDVTISSASNGQLLRYNAGVWSNWTPNFLTAHPPITNGGSVNNSLGTVVQDITVDANGHVTAIGSVNLDTRYYTQDDIAALFGGDTAIAGYNLINWDTAYGWGNHASAGYATTSYVTTAIANLVDAAPATLDTLNELAAALGDDPNFATTVTNSIAGKVSKSGDTMTGALTLPNAVFTNDASSRFMYLRGAGNIIQFQDAAANNKWEVVGREGTFYIYKNDGAGSAYKYQIDGNGNHTITGDLVVTGGFSASGYNKSNWDTAFGWGNHALAGYLTSYQNNYISDVRLQESILEFTGQGSAFTGNIDLSTLPFQPIGSYLTAEADTLATVVSRGSTTTSSISTGALTALADNNVLRSISQTADTSLPTKTIAEFAGIYNSGSNRHQMFISSTAGLGPWEINQTKTWGGILSFGVSSNGTSITRKLYVTPDSVGVNVYPTSGDQMEVAGTLRVHTGNNWDGVQIYADGQAGYIRGRGDEIGLHIRSEYGNVLLASDRGNVAVGKSTASFKLDVGGNARFDNEIYVNGVWSSGYGPRNNGENINFWNWSGNVKARISTSTGVIAANDTKLSLGILDLNSGDTPTQFRINTKIPFVSGGADFTVNIKGFRYGDAQMVSLSIGWHYYANQLYNRTAISNGAWSPTITMAKDANGFVVIHLAGPGYWPKLYVESVHSSAYGDAYSSNWSWTDADLSDCTDVQSVTYRPLATSITGNSATTSQTNFSTLTLNSAGVATQAWVQSQGYLTSETDSQTLDWDAPNKNLSITNGNTVTLDGLATEEFVTSQGYITGYTETDTLASVTGRGNTANSRIIINSTGAAGAPTLSVNTSTSSTFVHSQENLAANLTAGQHNIIVVGKTGNTKNSGYIGYYWAGAASDSNFVTIGHWGADDLFRVYGDGRATVGTNTVWHAGNDGSGSGLDADLLDGQQGSYYQPASSAITTSNIGSQYVDGANRLGSYTGNTSGSFQAWNLYEAGTARLNPTADTWYYGMRISHGDAENYYSATLAISFFSEDLYLRRTQNGTPATWYRFWHNGDFGTANISNWNTAYNDKINSASFNTNTGVLTLTQQDGGTVTVDLDGRYVTSDSDNQELTWDLGAKTLGITGGNSVVLDLATEDFVTSQGYITGYTETDTLATVTGRGATTNSNITTGSQISVQADGGSGYVASRIYLFSHNNYRGAGVFMSGTGSTWFAGTPYTDFDQNYIIARRAVANTDDTAQFSNALLRVNATGDVYVSRHLYANYVLGTYANFTSGNSENPTIGQIWTQSTGDDYLRKSTPAHFRSQVVDGYYLSLSGGTITTSSQYGVVINHSPALGDFVDALLLRSTTSAQRAQIGFATVDADGDHHRASIRAYKGAGTYEGVFGIALRQTNATHVQRFTLTSTGNLTIDGQMNVSGGNSSNWNTAYGWGNHADYGYWNTDSVDAKNVQSAEVVFAGNVTVEGTFTESSSIRFKENITRLDPALDKVNQLEAVSYNKIGVDDREIGLIAEDVAELFPEVVTYNEEGQPQGIQYQRLSVILLKAVQELTERVNKLENK